MTDGFGEPVSDRRCRFRHRRLWRLLQLRPPAPSAGRTLLRPRWIDRGEPVVAALWTPHPGQADDGGCVPPAFLWAGLDCPGGLAALGGEAAKALTGRIHAEVDGDLSPGEPCRIMGWLAGADGRKRYAGTALFDNAGPLRGRALANLDPVAPVMSD